MKRTTTGKYVNGSLTGRKYKAFVPNLLPPKPPIVIDAELNDLLEKSNIALGRLDGVASILPDISWFLFFYVRKEAILSSQIEGTQSSLSDLLIFEKRQIKATTVDEIKEVSNYVKAMRYGLRQLRQDFPLSLRLLRDIHKILLSSGRGASKTPGEFRKNQNWIGGTNPINAIFVPPPPNLLIGLLSDFEKFFHDDSIKLPVLIKTALVHVQFETIHPFLDGNGRLGRLLITFLLCAYGILNKPLLYLSLYFKKNRSTYYDLLQKVREEGEWEEWLKFFMAGVYETANQGFNTAKLLLELFDKDRKKIESAKKRSTSLLRVYQLLQKEMIVSIPSAAKTLKLSQPTITSALKILINMGIVGELTGQPRNRFFHYIEFYKILEEGTEPL